MPDGAASDIGLGQFRNFNGALHTGGNSHFLKRILEGHGIDESGQHPHIICRDAVNPSSAIRSPAPNVSSPHNDSHLDLTGKRLSNFFGTAMQRIDIDAIPLFAAE